MANSSKKRPRPSVVEPGATFRNISKADVETALADPDPANPIARELARLILGYIGNYRAHVERLGYIPTSFLHLAPRCPMEAVAMRLTTDIIKAAIEEC